MHYTLFLFFTLLTTSYLSGCASVPLAPVEEDKARKEFSLPTAQKAGLYIFRDSNAAAPQKKSVYIDGEYIGETAPMTFLYEEINPGKRVLSTESEFSNNDLILEAESGKNYFVRQFLKLGIFVAGALLQQVPQDEGMKAVAECRLATRAGNSDN